MKLKTIIIAMCTMLIGVAAYSQDTIITVSPKNIILCKILSVDMDNHTVVFSTGNTTNTYSTEQMEYCSNYKAEELIKNRIKRNMETGIAEVNEKKKVDSIGFHKGSVLIGGNISYSSEGINSSSLTLLPEIVCFTSNEFALMFGLGTTQINNGNPATSSMVDINFGIRYYFLSLTKRCRIFTGFSFADSIGSSKIFTFNAGLGLDYFATQKLVIDFNLTNFISYTDISYSGSSSSQFNFVLNKFTNIFTSPSVGLIYKL
ncbi:MAG: hypothetical protein ACLQQ4_01025 [Bacteroidia bacterium]